MNQPLFQKQHRTPQVYLKQFSFKKGNNFYVKVFDRIKGSAEDIRINDYNITINGFDYPFEDFKEKRHYENSASRIEDIYPRVINTLNNQNQLTLRHEDVLRHFVASLIVRSKRQRDFFSELISDKNTRKHFLEEVTMFDKEDNPLIIEAAFSFMDKNEHLPLIQGIITNHIVRILRSFKAIILKDFNKRGWFTCDDPVCIDFQDNYSWIIPVEAEIYLPLSCDFCLFLFHEKSPKSSNPLRKFSSNRIHQLDDDTHTEITKRIILNTYQTLVIPPAYEDFLNRFRNDITAMESNFKE